MEDNNDQSTSSMGDEAVFTSICTMLTENNVTFRKIHHEATYTSEDSARVRNEDLSIGGKAILMKIDDKFQLFVLSASLKTDSKKIKEYFKAKKIRFATADELVQLTKLVPGSVPPFGQPILPFNLYVDNSIANNEKIAFNAGLLTDSIVMLVKDYLDVSKPNLFKFSVDSS